jgi:hypothetical protein
VIYNTFVKTRSRTLLTAAAFLALVASASAAPNGRVRFAQRQNPSFDKFTNNPGPVLQQWLRDHMTRMMEFSPYFDQKTSWFSGAQVYVSSHAIYNPSSQAAQHADWILKDARGNNVFINWGCGGGTCPQYAADLSNSAFRSDWITNTLQVTSNGYVGVWIDDVNLDFRFSDGNGVDTIPMDPITHSPMTEENWRLYFAQFLEQIHAAMPSYEMTHNSIWYAGGATRDADPYVQRQIKAANYINVEGGFNDPGLTGGTGDWSVSSLWGYIDRVHALGTSVTIDDFGANLTEYQYALASFFLITNGSDRLGNGNMNPNNWWKGYDVDLGTPSGTRTQWNNLWRRDFSNGLVLLNEPNAKTVTVPITGNYHSIDGTTVTSVTLTASQGIVLLGAAPPPPPPPPTFVPVYVNAGGPAYTDASHVVWSADTGFSGGTAWGNSRSPAPVQYRTLRYGASFQYDFAVANGTRKVTLKFAEIYYTTAKQRMFNVSINGTQVLNQFDIVAAGGANKAVDKTFSVPVTAGKITIQFTSGSADAPQVNAIQITN